MGQVAGEPPGPAKSRLPGAEISVCVRLSLALGHLYTASQFIIKFHRLQDLSFFRHLSV